jgi:predicted Ser/Thr protein kinase
MSASFTITRAEIESATIAVLQRVGAYRPRVVHFVWREREWVFKDFRDCWLLVRWTIGILSVRRERNAYERLQGLAGIPTLQPSPDRWSLVIEFVPGHSLSKKNLAAPEALLEKLDRLLEAMHDRGVAHLDLRTKTNIRVDAQGQPWLIDFSSAYLRGRIPLLSKLLMKLGRLADRSASIKYRMRYAKETMQASQYVEMRKQKRWRSLLVMPAINQRRRDWKKARRRPES